jgi:hypothetical protein
VTPKLLELTGDSKKLTDALVKKAIEQGTPQSEIEAAVKDL